MIPEAIWPPTRGSYSDFATVGSRYSSGFFVDDQTNSAYVFGGYVNTGNAWQYKQVNDLWKCDFNRELGVSWSWIHGARGYEDPGVYTFIGDTNEFIYPGARSEFGYFYDTEMRKYFLFGGQGFSNNSESSYLGDHWMYDVETNRFTWVGGSTTPYLLPEYTLHEESASNALGGFFGPAFAYDQENKLFYMFGGQYDGYLSSILWRYSVSANTVTALSGSLNNDASVIYTNDTSTENVMPGGREDPNMILTEDNILYIMGGDGYHLLWDDPEQAVRSRSSEFWKYDLNEERWSFISGTNIAFDVGNYSSDPLIGYPRSRYCAILIHDRLNNQILLHGGASLIREEVQTELDDEWLFNITTQQWKFILGKQAYGNEPDYGERRVSSQLNRLGWRECSAVYSSPQGNYIFSGHDNEDLWKLTFLNASELNTPDYIPATNHPSQTTKTSIRGSAVSSSKAPNSPVESERLLDPVTVVYIAIGAGFVVLAILVVVVIGFLKYRSAKLGNTTFSFKSLRSTKSTGSYNSGNYETAVQLKTVSTLNTVGATLFTETGDVLSVPAYLEVTDSSFRITSKLSQGGAGDVFLADAMEERTKIFGNILVVKSMKVKSSNPQVMEKQLKLFEQELSVMSMFRNHRNFAKIVGFCRADTYSILMKYYPLGSLDKFLQNRRNLVTKSLMVHFISDIAVGIDALHQKDFSHSDIKTANVLIDVDSEGFAFCVLTDFGIAQVLSLNLVVNGFNVTNIRGLSFAYAAPETFARQKSKQVLGDKPEVFKAGDVYTFGSVIYEMFTRVPPWMSKRG